MPLRFFLETPIPSSYFYWTLALLVISLGLVIKFFRDKIIERKSYEKELKRLTEQTDLLKLQHKELKQELNQKNILLANISKEIIVKKNLLNRIQKDMEKSANRAEDNPKTEALKIAQMIAHSISEDDQWITFQKQFSQIHPDFFKGLTQKYPNLTRHEIRLCTYFRMNLTNKEIAKLLNISAASLIKARYRLKKKMDLPKSANLDQIIRQIGRDPGNSIK